MIAGLSLSLLSPVIVSLGVSQVSPNSHVGRWVAPLSAIDALSPFRYRSSWTRLHALYSVLVVSIVFVCKPRIPSGRSLCYHFSVPDGENEWQIDRDASSISFELTKWEPRREVGKRETNGVINVLSDSPPCKMEKVDRGRSTPFLTEPGTIPFVS